MRLCLIPTCKYRLPFGRSFSVFSIQVLHLQRFATFTRTICSSLDGFVVVPIKEKWPGEPLNTTTCCASCTSLPMREHTSSGALAQPSRQMESFTLRTCPAHNGIPL